MDMQFFSIMELNPKARAKGVLEDIKDTVWDLEGEVKELKGAIKYGDIEGVIENLSIIALSIKILDEAMDEFIFEISLIKKEK